MKLSMIAAMGENRVIGKDNDIPWHLPDDFKFFKETTSGHHVIMGRKNYESLPHKFKPLPNRPNLIVTRNKTYVAEGTIILHDLESAIQFAKNHDESEAFIIGGGQIYELALPLADRLYLTHIKASFEGDTFFPTINKLEWEVISSEYHPSDERHQYAFDFVIYDRKK